MNSLRTGDYHVTFISRHPAIEHICDDVSRWWSEWLEYYVDNSNIPVYSSRMILSPKRKPDLTKYISWTDTVHLTDTLTI